MSKLFYLLIAFAILSIALTIGYVSSHQKSAEERAPFRKPPSSPVANRVAGAGIVEAASRNILIGTFVPGIIAELPVVPGQSVKKGDVLLRLDARDVQATVDVQAAAVAVAQKQYDELKRLPRPEDVLIAEADVRSAQAALTQQTTRMARANKLIDENAISKDERDAIVEAEQVAVEQLASAKAALVKLNAGAWEPQLATAAAQIKQAEAALALAKTNVELRTVKAPSDGVVLQVNVQVGQYVNSVSSETLMVFGDTQTLHVRTDIDEVDIPRFEQAQTAIAYRRGDAKTPYRLKLLRIEPLVIPKQTLTGELQERTDTRVLQAIFEVVSTKDSDKLFVGQQMDVFAELLTNSERN